LQLCNLLFRFHSEYLEQVMKLDFRRWYNLRAL